MHDKIIGSHCKICRGKLLQFCKELPKVAKSCLNISDNMFNAIFNSSVVSTLPCTLTIHACTDTVIRLH